MNKNQIENNLKEIIEIYKKAQVEINNLLKGVKTKCDEILVLDEFLDTVGLEKNEETRYAAYTRIALLRETALELVLEKGNFSEEQVIEILDSAYGYVCDYHMKIQSVLISLIEKKELLTPFYLEIFKGTYNVGLAFNDLFLPWRNNIINGTNKDLENRFDNDSEKVIDFLNENNLFDLGHHSNIADRSYSALVLEDGEYKSKSYSEVFAKEIGNIVKEIDIFIENLSNVEDEIYDSKQNYLDYLLSLKVALLETNVNDLVEKWSKVDEAWMNINTPFQITHPLEFYEDKYRKAVAPEWDLRIDNTVFESDVETSIEKMYETFYDDIGREKYKSSYDFSLSSLKRVQLHLSSPVLYFTSGLTGLPSAQVVPNDDVVSKKSGKKIFAFPEMVLENKRSYPYMKMSSVVLEEKLLEKHRKCILGDDKNFYKVYDIETIGHELGHTLWLDSDTETVMNGKTGVFKNIEEFKATTGGLVMYFTNPDLAPGLEEEVLLHHITRCISLLKYREINEWGPYYCEGLIHIDILFESGIIIVNSDNKIELVFNEETYNNLKEIYITHYKKLIRIYLEKQDAGIFLSDYTVKNKDGYYLPKNEEIRKFVEYYYSVYKDIGNEIDDSVSKEDYITE